jgi:hypothetical protein
MNSRSELNQMLIIANNRLHNPYHVISCEKYEGYRIIITDIQKDRFTELSPRMSVKNLVIWMSGFIEGIGIV